MERKRVCPMNMKSRRIAGLKVSRVAPTTMDRVHSSLPDLAPPEERLRSQKRQIFSSDAISLSQSTAMHDVLDSDFRAERNDVIARLTVYALNMTIMVFTVPIGMALLVLNITAGENLRTTAHVMALTGLFSALAAANPGLFAMPI
ncbi:MAG: hypothetical protein AAFR73_07730 [Pseudomonadota bacterium]